MNRNKDLSEHLSSLLDLSGYILGVVSFISIAFVVVALSYKVVVLLLG
jgi:hypothetical protein